MSFRLVSFLCWIVAWESLLHAQNDDFPIVAEDLEVRLFARDPLVRNPCAMAFDARGRLFVGMGPQYRKPKPDTPGDSVYELIDTDFDGVYESGVTSFTSNQILFKFNLPSGDLIDPPSFSSRDITSFNIKHINKNINEIGRAHV